MFSEGGTALSPIIACLLIPSLKTTESDAVELLRWTEATGDLIPVALLGRAGIISAPTVVSLSSDSTSLLVDPNRSFKVRIVGVTSAFVNPPFLRCVGDSPTVAGKVVVLRLSRGDR